MQTRLEFFLRLREGLAKLPPDEIENALRYYTEYFDDAGPENEQRVLEELGDPVKIAQTIVAENMVRDIVAPPPPRQQESPEAARPKRGFSAVWTVVLAVFALPIALPLAIAVAAVAFALVAAAAALIFAFFAVSVSLIVGGVFGFFTGAAMLGTHIPTAIYTIGTGIAVSGVGLLLLLPMIWLARTSFTAIAQLIGRRVFQKKGVSL